MEDEKDTNKVNIKIGSNILASPRLGRILKQATTTLLFLTIFFTGAYSVTVVDDETYTYSENLCTVYFQELESLYEEQNRLEATDLTEARLETVSESLEPLDDRCASSSDLSEYCWSYRNLTSGHLLNKGDVLLSTNIEGSSQ